MSIEEGENTVEEVIESTEIVESTPVADEPEFTSIDDIRALTDGSREEVEVVDSVEAIVEDGEPAWALDYTYKVKDEVMEFPEHLRGSIASKEQEDELRDLYTRAAGLDSYKSKNTELMDQNNELAGLKPELNRLVDGYRNIKELRDGKQYHKLIETLNWDKEDLIDFAEELLSEEELPEDQRVAIEGNRLLEKQVQALKYQVENFQSSEERRDMEAEEQELGTILSHEDYAEKVALLSEVGVNVEQDVISLGTQMFNDSGRKIYPSVSDVVAKVFENRQLLIDKIAPNITKNVEEVKTEQVGERVIVRQPTLPKVSGTNNNVLDEVYSLDKLREMSDQIPNRTY